MKIYGYARVSSVDQNLERQFFAFKCFGIPTKNVYFDKKSGKDFSRKEYLYLTSILKKGDLLVIQSLDRLGRNYEQILSEWERITKVIQADMLVLDMPLLDTRTKTNTLVGKFIADLVLQVLSFVAENERQNIRLRQKEGIRLAKERGVKFGRPCRNYTTEFIHIMKEYKQKQIALQDALHSLNLQKSAFYKHLSILTTQKLI